MPEGPEAKIASDYFNKLFLNSKKLNFEIISEYYHQKYSDIFNQIKHNLHKFKQTYTIGKNIFLDLENQKKFNIHLGMTGGWSSKLIKHCHFRVFDSDKEIFFRDIRKFGKIKIIPQDEFHNLFHPEFDSLNKSYNIQKHINYLQNKIKNNKSICSILMNQKYFPGVGNYIKAESLYKSKIHPEEKWGNLDAEMKKKLIKNVNQIMNNSYKLGGAELKDFKNPFNQSKFKLKIYGQKYTKHNNPVISKRTSDYRKSWFCLKEQKLI
ncbi:MAG: hypothetical protein CMD08_04435 [Flavobacteriales bacterium]|nr:hypothetical protein [Flavobacteriales bacterium]|tara:strand:+ start:2409 stop:3206 length:798 start_codon:yes stop_codon:yes gene_type:complete